MAKSSEYNSMNTLISAGFMDSWTKLPLALILGSISKALTIHLPCPPRM